MNWPDPGESSPPPDDAEAGSSQGRTEGDGEDQHHGSTPDPGDPPGDAVWLSSDDLASSPRPWEDRDPSEFPDDAPADAPSDEGGPREPAFETPTYAQLRSEAADDLGRWERPTEDRAAEPPAPDVPTAPVSVVSSDERPDVIGEGEGRPPARTHEDAISGPYDGAGGHDPRDPAPAAGSSAPATPPSGSGMAVDDDREPPGPPVEDRASSQVPDPADEASQDVPPADSRPIEVAAPAEVEGRTEHRDDAGPSPEGTAGDAVEATADAARTDGDPSVEAFHGEPLATPEQPFHGEHPPAPTSANAPSPSPTFHGERGDVDEQSARGPAVNVIEDALAGLDSGTRSATVICVANQKGGVGKTTTTVSLGAALAMEGAQVLVVDLDPQGNATTGLGLRAQEGAPSTYRVIVEQMDVEDAAEPTAVRGLHVLPSSLDLAGAEIELVPAFSRENRLKQALDAVRDLYDVILIDCPPSLGLLTINALVAADQVLVPIQCEYYALEGLGQLMRTVKLVADSLNRGLAVGGVVLTMFDGRTNLSQQVADEVRGYFGDIAYQTIVPRTVRLSEAPSYGQPIGVFDAASRGARAYQRLAREVARRLDLELEGEEVSPLDRLLGSSAAPTPDEAAPLPTDLAPEDVPGGGTPDDPDHEHGSDEQHHEPQGDEQHHEHHEDHHTHEHHEQGDDQPVPGTEGQP